MECRHCGSRAVSRLGELPRGMWFAGRRLDPAMPGGWLWRCRDCDFLFRAPIPSDGQLAELYSAGSSEVWASGGDREDFRRIRRRLPGANSVLDVGCYTGELLAPLPDAVQRYGVEPNREAAAIAASRGIFVLGPDIAALAGSGQRFDAVTLCDVVEHVPQPAQFIEALWALVAPGGRLLISTGAGDALLWRFARQNFWYCFFPEHISFLSERWMRTVVVQRSLGKLEVERFNYLGLRSGSPLATLKLAAALVYASAPGLYRRVREREGPFAPPGCGASRDHVLFVIHKPMEALPGREWTRGGLEISRS